MTLSRESPYRHDRDLIRYAAPRPLRLDACAASGPAAEWLLTTTRDRDHASPCESRAKLLRSCILPPGRTRKRINASSCIYVTLFRTSNGSPATITQSI